MAINHRLRHDEAIWWREGYSTMPTAELRAVIEEMEAGTIGGHVSYHDEYTIQARLSMAREALSFRRDRAA